MKTNLKTYSLVHMTVFLAVLAVGSYAGIFPKPYLVILGWAIGFSILFSLRCLQNRLRK